MRKQAEEIYIRIGQQDSYSFDYCFGMHQDTTRVTQPNLIEDWFARKSHSRQWRIFSPANL